MRSNENFNKKLLVEGKNDQHVVLALCQKFNLNQSFDIIDCEGIENLFAQIPIRLKQSSVDTIGIIVDADTDLQARWDRIKSIFHTINIGVPDHLPEQGLIFRIFDSIKIGVWIMPDNKLDGMIEDFTQFMIPTEDTLFPIINENIEDIERKNLNKYQSIHKSKALIHSWLAVQEEPGTPLGLSITRRYLTTDTETCNKFMDWLSELFQD